jgi:dihydrolipoamide dehydrogenase
MNNDVDVVVLGGGQAGGDRKTSEIIGVHIFTRGAASLIGEASLIVSGKLTVRDVARAVHPHPTLTEAFGFLALDMLGRL